MVSALPLDESRIARAAEEMIAEYGACHVRSWGYTGRKSDMARTSLPSQEQKSGCRELSKTTSSCRDLAVEANTSAVGSKSGQLSVS